MYSPRMPVSARILATYVIPGCIEAACISIFDHAPEPKVQGMSFLAAGLLLYEDEPEAFRILCSMLDEPLLSAFVNVDVAEVCA